MQKREEGKSLSFRKMMSPVKLSRGMRMLDREVGSLCREDACGARGWFFIAVGGLY